MQAAASPAARVAFVSLPSPYRACELCIHGCQVAGRLTCQHPGAGYAHGVDTPVATARAFGGHCGPEAHQLDFPGLHP
jgi:hypothetical protein